MRLRVWRDFASQKRLASKIGCLPQKARAGFLERVGCLMLHNKRCRPPLYKRKNRSSERLPWEVDVTLCIAAVSIGSRMPPRDLSFAMVTVTDERVETDSAGGNFGEKSKAITKDDHWHALFADRVSSAHDFASTLKETLRPERFTDTNLVDKLTEGSVAHKEKLIDRLVRLKFGFSFGHFREHGSSEVPDDVRNRLWYEIEKLDYGCEFIVFGFLSGVPRMLDINRYGDVERSEHFSAIGTGATVAESSLFARGQTSTTELNDTIYNAYEAFRVACRANPPGVAGGPLIRIFEPDNNDRDLIISRYVTTSGRKTLQKCFDKYGPKKTKNIPTLKDDDFFTLPDCFLLPQREERLRARFEQQAEDEADGSTLAG